MSDSARPLKYSYVTTAPRSTAFGSPKRWSVAPPARPLRLFYAAGPGNIIGTYRHWKSGKDDPSQVAITYSGQFFDLCQDLGAVGYAIAAHPTPDTIRDKNFTIEHLPKPAATGSLAYHWNQVWHGLQIMAAILKSKADVAIVADGTTHWFVLAPLSWLGVKVVPSIHCVLWRKYQPLKRKERWLLALDRVFFRHFCAGVLAVSDEIAEQVEDLTGTEVPPIAQFLPIYRREAFAGVESPSQERSPFRVVFAGRIEREKGVFDLLAIAQQLAQAGRTDITFDLCGDGTQLEALRQAAQAAGLADRFVCHGHCNKTQMRAMFNRAHAIVVPTRTDFVEGFNKVVVEGILSGRPVVTSAVCPALSYLKDAVVEVPPDQPTAYADALVKLCDDPDFYAAKQAACGALQEQFYDETQGWSAAVRSILGNLGFRRAGFFTREAAAPLVNS